MRQYQETNGRRRPILSKMLLSTALLGGAASIAGLGTFATFSNTASASHTVSSGTVTLALGTTGASTNRLNVDATNVGPGDTIQRSFDLANTGSMNLSSITLTTTAAPSSKLDTDVTNGLQMVIDRCSVAWTESGSSPNFSYTCGGSTTSIIATRAVIGSNLSMSGLSALTGGGSDHLRLTLTLPSSADSTFEGLTSTLTYAFTGTH